MEQKYVRYEDFGAIGDSKTDDYDAIKRAHEYANEHGLDVVCDDSSKIYYIGDTGTKESIYVKTNVDWGKAQIVIDDSEITSDMPARNSILFKIWYDSDPVTYTAENDTPNEAIARINQNGGIPIDEKLLDLGLGYPALVQLMDENKTVFIRRGANQNAGRAQEELIVIDKDGNIDPTTPFLLKFDAVTSIKVFRIDDKPITVKGGIFTTIANRAMEDYRYYQRGIYVSRSNVTVTDMVYKVTGEGDHGDPYLAFISFRSCANVLMKDCTLDAHKYYMCMGRGGSMVGMGTYAFDALFAHNVTWQNCVQSNFFLEDGKTPNSELWGIMGSSYCKNLTYDNCLLSRFDAHQGIYNAKIKDSTISSVRIVGGGDFTIENSTVYAATSLNIIVEFREDYGAFWRGNITLKDVTFLNRTKNGCSDVSVMNGHWANHDFGYPISFATNVTVDNLKLGTPAKVDLYKTSYLNSAINADKDEIETVGENGESVISANISKPTPPKTITLKNNIDNLQISFPDKEKYPLFKNTEYIVEN